MLEPVSDPGCQIKLFAPLADKLLLTPQLIAVPEPEILTFTFTSTVNVAVLVQPFELVPVTV